MLSPMDLASLRSLSTCARLQGVRFGLAHLLLVLHDFRMPGPLDARLVRRAVEFGMDVVVALAGILLLLDGNAVSVGPCVMANAGHLPGDFHVGLVGFYAELVVS